MKNRILIISVVLLSGILNSCTYNANPEITTEELLDHISYLASEELQGRFPGTKGDKEAADYILEQFKRYGLDIVSPAGMQEMEITTAVSMGDSNKFVLDGQEKLVKEDYIPLSFSKNGEADGEIIFVGYGLKTNKYGANWDDFKDVEIEGKIALVMDGGPEKPETGMDPFDGLLSPRSKILNARDLGASAVIFVSGPLFDSKDNLEFVNNKEAPSGIPVIRISRKFADQLLFPMNQTTEELELACKDGKQKSFPLGIKASIKTHVTPEKVSTQNVVGILRAPEGKADEYVVFGGHYDHLGTGGTGTGTRSPDSDEVHYGADDNASGTAGVIELAGYFAGKKQELKRSMIFVAFAAEEMGLLGSKYFVENPPVDIEKIKVMFNLDMIGRLNDENRVTIGGTGTAAEFDSLLNLVSQHDLNIKTSPEGSGPSDHASFYAKDIPVLFLSTGAHPEYHTPGDSVGSLNQEGMNQVTNYVAELSSLIASQDKLSYREAGPKRTTSTRQNLKVTLGFMPDFTDNSNTGMRVDFPTPGKPAARAGIVKGDRIIGINGLKVTNIQDYMLRLKSLEPGQIVSVEIDRDGEKLVLLVQL